MTEQDKIIIEKICEKRVDTLAENEMKGLTFYGTMRFYDHLIKEYGETAANQLLFGFLSEKETLVACFGEEEVIQTSGRTKLEYAKIYNTVNMTKILPDKINEIWEKKKRQHYLIPAWQYRGQQMVGLSLSGRLAYFREAIENKGDML